MAIILALVIALQSPWVQTFIADRVAKKLSENLDADISLGKVHFRPFSTLILKDIVIIDRNAAADAGDYFESKVDTFFMADYISAEFTFRGLTGKNGLKFRKATVRDGRMNLVIEDNPDEPGDKTNNLTRIFRIRSTGKKSEKEIFNIRQAEIEGFRFTMKNYCADKIWHEEGGIDWNDLDVSGIDINAQGLGFKGGVMSGVLKHLSFMEKSGYSCESVTGQAKVGNGRTIVEDLHIKDPWSDVRLPRYIMSYSGVADFSDYIRKVVMTAMISESSVDMRTIAYFAPQLKGNPLKVKVSSGEFHGTVNDFSVKDIKVSAAGGFRATINGRMTGLPSVDSTYINASATDFTATAAGAGNFISCWMKEGGPDLSRFAKGSIFRINATAKGMLDRLAVKADIKSGSGSIKGDIRLKNLIKKGIPTGIAGTLSTANLDIGKIVGTNFIGPVTMHTDVRAKFGEGKYEAIIDSLSISRLNIYGYDYSRISGTGTLSGDSFDGKIACNDPGLSFIFHGNTALSSKNRNAAYNFYLGIGHADLHAMNIDKRGKSNITLITRADFRKTRKGDIFGEIYLSDIVLENSSGKYEIGDVSLYSQTVNDKYKMMLTSDFAEGTYSASAPVTQFISDLAGITMKQELPALFEKPEYTWEGNEYRIDFTCHDSRGLLSFVMPGLYIAEDTRLSANINEKGKFDASLHSQRIAFGRQYMKDIAATFSNNDNSFSGNLTCNEIQAATLRLSDNTFRLFADDNHIGLKYSYDNGSELENSGEFIVRGELARKAEEGVSLGINILPSTLHLNSREWNILPSHLSFRRGETDIESINIVSGEQDVKIFGKASRTETDTLTLELGNFDISVLNHLFTSDPGISGDMTGTARLISPLDSKSFLCDIVCDSAYFADRPLGTISAVSEWNEMFQRFNISVRNELDGQRNIDMSGTYTPKIRSLDAHAVLNRLSAGYARPFLEDIFSGIDGSISGEFTAEGPLDKLELSSRNARLDNGMLKVAFTNVPYYADGNFHLDRHGVYFDNIAIRDRFSGSGNVTGSINWNNFRDISFDTKIGVKEIEGINLTEAQGESFYGNIFGTGNVGISGPVNSLFMDIEAVTAKRGELHIPINFSATSGTSNLLKFTEIPKEIHIDPYDEMIANQDKKEKESSDFRVNLNITALPDVTAYVEIDKASGHVLSGQGSGKIDLEVGKDLFNINGDYTLTGGSYRFVALGFVRKDFTIQDGSTVNFNGDIFDSSLNIEALYRTKASLSTLISDTTSVANRRTVECGIKITDKISNPRLAFSIGIPDLDPTVKSRVESALSTEDKVQRQFLSLLLSNSFIPDEQSGIVNNSTMLYSNVTEIMTNQLNNILQKLNIPVDLGLNYQPNERGNDVFDVAVSTQIFNNRVIVNGSVGNRQYNSGSTKADVVGDLDIEVKLDRQGSFRLKIFSHSADQYTNYLDNSQRSGAGLTYQTEFSKLSQFFRNLFSSKSKRQEFQMAEEQAIFEGSRVEMKITADDNRRNGRKKRKTVPDSLPAGRK